MRLYRDQAALVWRKSSRAFNKTLPFVRQRVRLSLLCGIRHDLQAQWWYNRLWHKTLWFLQLGPCVELQCDDVHVHRHRLQVCVPCVASFSECNIDLIADWIVLTSAFTLTEGESSLTTEFGCATLHKQVQKELCDSICVVCVSTSFSCVGTEWRCVSSQGVCLSLSHKGFTWSREIERRQAHLRCVNMQITSKNKVTGSYRLNSDKAKISRYTGITWSHRVVTLIVSAKNARYM